MSKRPDLEALLGKPVKSKGGRPAVWSKEVAKARRLEHSRRTGAAWQMTARALRAAHPEEWEALYEQAIAKVHAEAGPMPGEEEVKP